MTTKNEDYSSLNNILIGMIIFCIIGFAVIALVSFSYLNFLSFLLGGSISLINLLWLRRLVKKLAFAGKFNPKSGIEWGLKLLFIFGSIAIIVLKSQLNILIFIFGLSILPLSVVLNGVIGFIKTFMGGKNVSGS